jgi:flagellum-specific peptidoglycan hydrolase FlgJ
MYNAVYEAAKASGLPYPEVIASLGASQTSLETGYGKHMVGNNAFGIKGTGSAGTVNANTQEFVGGKMVGMKQGFRAYGDVTESANDYVNMMIKNQKRYSGVLTAKTVEEAIAAQAKSGYATDPSYGSKLASINSRFGGQNAAKPETKLAKSGPAINNASIDNKVGNEKLQQTASSSQVNNLITQSPSSQTPNQEPPKSGNEVDVRNRLGRLIAQT